MFKIIKLIVDFSLRVIAVIFDVLKPDIQILVYLIYGTYPEGWIPFKKPQQKMFSDRIKGGFLSVCKVAEVDRRLELPPSSVDSKMLDIIEKLKDVGDKWERKGLVRKQRLPAQAELRKAIICPSGKLKTKHELRPNKTIGLLVTTGRCKEDLINAMVKKIELIYENNSIMEASSHGNIAILANSMSDAKAIFLRLEQSRSKSPIRVSAMSIATIKEMRNTTIIIHPPFSEHLKPYDRKELLTNIAWASGFKIIFTLSNKEDPNIYNITNFNYVIMN